jgi:DNA mismatch repair protein MutS
MTRLAEQVDTVKNVHLQAVEHKDRIVFLHAVQDGPASQSYGLQVAALAGIPASVLEEAKARLDALERTARESTPQMSLFDSRASDSSATRESPPDPVHEKLGRIVADDLTPRQALDLVYELLTLTKAD